MARGMVQLTDFCDPTERINTQYGWTTWKNYLKLEKERIEKSPGRVVEIRLAKNALKYALFVNYVGVPILNGNYARTYES